MIAEKKKMDSYLQVQMHEAFSSIEKIIMRLYKDNERLREERDNLQTRLDSRDAFDYMMLQICRQNLVDKPIQPIKINTTTNMKVGIDYGHSIEV